MSKLRECPFCGSEAYFERKGDSRKSTLVRCTFCSCSFEDGSTFNHEKGWNTRTNDWQDISLAPKDTALLLWNGSHHIGHWNTSYRRWCTQTNGLGSSSERVLNSWNQPTHFKHLDTPPES